MNITIHRTVSKGNIQRQNVPVSFKPVERLPKGFQRNSGGAQVIVKTGENSFATRHLQYLNGAWRDYLGNIYPQI